MERFVEMLNSSLIKTYQSVARLEEQTLKKSSRLNLSINEMHMIEYIGREADAERTISDIAEGLGIKSPSVTVAVNKLVSKGYFEKINSKKDGRVVYVKLTRAGRKVYSYHRYYHRMMINDLTCDLSKEEIDVLVTALDKLTAFLQSGIELE